MNTSDLEKAKQALKLKNVHLAEEILLALIVSDAKNSEAHFLLGQIYHETGKFEKAIVEYKKALGGKPHYTDAAVSLSVLYNDLGRYEEARMIFNRAKNQIKTSDPIEDPYINECLAVKHIELGDQYLMYKRFHEALDEYEKALKLTPINMQIVIKIARLHEAEGALLEAVAILKKLKVGHPEFIPGLIQLGLSYYAQGRMLDAISEWERVLDMDPHNKDAMTYLEMVHQAQVTTL
ncbi:MAG: tetratricopeptide repeat protein [Deltaproteobacteria bacterium]|nr:tetratricopeptide repeat protein [Deltaproteobacteria bacterium]